jgi:hypothetical protein
MEHAILVHSPEYANCVFDKRIQLKGEGFFMVKSNHARGSKATSKCL